VSVFFSSDTVYIKEVVHRVNTKDSSTHVRLENSLKFNSFIVPSLLELSSLDLRSHGHTQKAAFHAYIVCL